MIVYPTETKSSSFLESPEQIGTELRTVAAEKLDFEDDDDDDDRAARLIHHAPAVLYIFVRARRTAGR